MELVMWLIPYILLSLLVGLLSGTVGVYIHTRRLSGIVGGLAHFSLGPISISYMLGKIIGHNVNYSLMGMFFMILVALFIPIDAKGRVKAENEVQVLWGVGMALGLLIMFLMPGYLNLDIFLFGSLLTISNTSIIALAIVTFTVLTVEFFFHNRLKYLGIDDDFLFLRGIHPQFFHRIQLIMIVVTIAILLEGIGILLMIGILTIPAVSASLLVTHSKYVIFVSIAIAIVGLISGLLLSYFFNLQMSSITTLLLGGFYFILRIFHVFRKK